MSHTEETELKHIFSKNDTARGIGEELARRRRNRWIPMSLNRIKSLMRKHGKPVVEQDFINTFKDLQAIGVGSLQLGTGRNGSKFIFNKQLRVVGSVILSPSETEVARQNQDALHGAINRDVIILVYRSNNKTARVELPRDMDDNSRKNLADLIIKS